MRMRNLATAAAAVGLLLGTSGAASALTLTQDFEAPFPGGPTPGPYTDANGITFDAVGGGGQLYTDFSPNGTLGLYDVNTPKKELRADLPALAVSVSVDLGDFDADPDDLFLEIFDSSDVMLDSLVVPITAEFTGMLTLSLSAPDIAYAIFGARNAANGSSVYADNLVVEIAEAVPEPSAAVTFLTGTLVFGWALRRRR